MNNINAILVSRNFSLYICAKQKNKKHIFIIKNIKKNQATQKFLTQLKINK